MTDYQPRRIYINSDDRISGSHRDFVVEIPSGVVNAKSASCTFASVPFLVYPFAPYQTYIFWRLNANRSYNTTLSTSPSTILITDAGLEGRYWANASAIKDQLNSDIVNKTFVYNQALGPAGSCIAANRITNMTGTELVFSADDNTKKFSFTAASGVKLMGYMDNVGGATPYYDNLTFWLSHANQYSPPEATWWSSTTDFIASGGSWCFWALNRTTNIYLASDFSSGDNITTDGRRDVLCKMPVNSSVAFADTVVFQQTMSSEDITRLPPVIKRIRIQVLDDDYNSLELPADGPGQVALTITFTY